MSPLPSFESFFLDLIHQYLFFPMHSLNMERLNRMARKMKTSIFVKNGPSYAGLGFSGEGTTTFTIATPTGESTTSARCFARRRRCCLTTGFNIR